MRSLGGNGSGEAVNAMFRCARLLSRGTDRVDRTGSAGISLGHQAIVAERQAAGGGYPAE